MLFRSLLRELGSFLASNVRSGDIACRFGGEEFILILPDTPLEVTHERAEQIWEGVQNITLNHRGSILRPLTLSVGIAVFPLHGESPDDLLRAADNALYQAKREGRNRVVISEAVDHLEE